MLTLLTRNWWLVVARGLLTLMFGITIIIWPHIMLTALVLLFGVFAITHGLLTIAALLRRKVDRRHWILLLEAGASILVGSITVVWPNITALALLYLIAAWALLTGLFLLLITIGLHAFVGDLWLLAASGLISLVFGAALLLWPASGVLAVIGIIAVFASIYGVLLLVLGLQLYDLYQLFGGRSRTV